MFWRVHVTTDDSNGGRDVECAVAAPTSIQAVMAAIATLDLRENELLHNIHVGKPKDNLHDK